MVATHSAPREAQALGRPNRAAALDQPVTEQLGRRAQALDQTRAEQQARPNRAPEPMGEAHSEEEVMEVDPVDTRAGPETPESLHKTRVVRKLSTSSSSYGYGFPSDQESRSPSPHRPPKKSRRSPSPRKRRRQRSESPLPKVEEQASPPKKAKKAKKSNPVNIDWFKKRLKNL